jgi:hypothetical protein
MIGAKTLATLALFAALVGATVGLGVFTPERLMMRGPGALVLVGAFGIVVGTAFFRMGRFGEKSRHYLRFTRWDDAWEASETHFVGAVGKAGARVVVGENKAGDAFDLPRRAQLAVLVLSAALLSLATLDGRSVGELLRFGTESGSLASTYCPDEEDDKAKGPKEDPNEPGCELVRRAYALGYAKSLGSCARKKDSGAEAGKPPCTRRQRDEPVLHYSYRLLAGFWRTLRGAARGSTLVRAEKEFTTRAHHMTSLAKVEAETLASAPHAAQHVWTNLPDPKDSAFEERTCTSRYLRLPHRPAVDGSVATRSGAPRAEAVGERSAEGPSASVVFEHVVGQLLFEGTYDTAAANCREFHVHWGAPPDACARLAVNPDEFLAASGALPSAQAALARWRARADLVALGEPAPPADPARFLTFHCYIESPEAGRDAKRTSLPFVAPVLGGARFTADEVRVAPSSGNNALYSDRYNAVAAALEPKFTYGALLSEAGIDEITGVSGIDRSFLGADFLLTRLYELDNVDIYLDPGWLATRPDLFDVYPYEKHLANFVQTFRRQYRQENTRL